MDSWVNSYVGFYAFRRYSSTGIWLWVAIVSAMVCDTVYLVGGRLWVMSLVSEAANYGFLCLRTFDISDGVRASLDMEGILLEM